MPFPGAAAFLTAVQRAPHLRFGGGGGGAIEPVASADFVQAIYTGSGGALTQADVIAFRDGAAIDAGGVGGTGFADPTGAFLADIQTLAATAAGLSFVIEAAINSNTLFYFNNWTSTNGVDMELSLNAGSAVADVGDWLGPGSILETDAAAGDPPQIVTFGITLGNGRYCASVNGSTPSEDQSMGAPNPFTDGAPFFEFINGDVRLRRIDVYAAVSNAELAALTA